MSGTVIGLPPVLNFGSEELKAKLLPDIFAARKFICLAVSEAQAGSDVFGLQTTAVKTEDGKYWIINGTFGFYFRLQCALRDYSLKVRRNGSPTQREFIIVLLPPS